LLTGEYPWRRPGTNILPGDARLIVSPDRATLPGVLRAAGYATAAIGKWHLGLGAGELDWNKEIKPGPCEVGFDTCYLVPATPDRVPCVYVQDHRVVGLDPRDPLSISYSQPIGREPTGKEHPELLKYPLSHGHDQTIVNGVSRIGYMSGGKAAWWVDEDMADTLARQALDFIAQNRARPFFLYFATHDIHVPHLPHARFVGKSGLGLRGDATLELDWTVGQVLDALDRLALADRTLLILSSDNGPVVDDGYRDGSVEHLDGHKPAGPLRGGKYSAFEAGTRVPLIVRWPGHVAPGTSEALVSHVDFFASLAALAGQPWPAGAAPDSRPALPALLGQDRAGRDYVVEHAVNGTLSVLSKEWKYIEPNRGPRVIPGPGIESGSDPAPQLYDLRVDLGERNNVAAAHPDKVREFQLALEKFTAGGRVRRPAPKDSD
jgi:arylsulfatase A-like enzyme